MAGTKICPNCGAKNPTSNRFCEDCGYDMNKATSSFATGVPLYCPNGHTVSDTSLGFCDVCGEKLTSVKPISEASGTTSISDLVADDVSVVSPAVASHGKKCPSCGAMNPEDGMFCEECGAALAVIPDLATESIVRHTTIRELPDIPDIMRTLTNNDMKR